MVKERPKALGALKTAEGALSKAGRTALYNYDMKGDFRLCVMSIMNKRNAAAKNAATHSILTSHHAPTVFSAILYAASVKV